MKREVQRIRITNTNKENFIRRITNNEYDDFLIRYLKFYSKILFGRTLASTFDVSNVEIREPDWWAGLDVLERPDKTEETSSDKVVTKI